MAELLEVLKPLLDRPFALFGHSLGALASFELARALTERGTPPAHLFFSGRRAPHLPDAAPRVTSLTDDEFLVRIREMNGTPEEILDDEDMVRMLLPVLRADFEMDQGYVFRPAPKLACPVDVLGGDADPEASDAELAAWGEHAAGPFRVTTFRGDHFYLHAREREVLQVIASRLGGSVSEQPRALAAARA